MTSHSANMYTKSNSTLMLSIILSPGGYITVWDVGNFLLDPSSEGSEGDQQQQRENDQESNKDDTKKESKVNCERTLSLQISICTIYSPLSLDWVRVRVSHSCSLTKSKLYHVLAHSMTWSCHEVWFWT